MPCKCFHPLADKGDYLYTDKEDGSVGVPMNDFG